MAEPWPEERNELLRSLVEKGLSASEIGEKIGITRNAVIGQCNRKGIQLKRAPGWSRGRKRSKEPSVPRISMRPKFVFGPGFVRSPIKPPLAVASVVEEKEPMHLTLVELKNNSCRWPYGETNFTFCGHEKIDDEKISYCPYHHKRSRAR